MFNLDKAIKSWKSDFDKNDSFTNDDIEELEVHLLDKIDSLKESGLSEEEAFIKANENIGSAEVLHNDFSTVNKIGIISKRIILGLFGYMFIVFLNDLIRLITTSILIPFAKSLINIPVSKNRLSGIIINFLCGDMANKLGEVSLIISSVLSVILICLIMSNKFDVINKITSKVKKKIYNKSYLSIATVIIAMIMLTLLVIVTPIVENMMIPRSYPSDIANIRIGIYGSRLIFDFLLAFIFIYKAYGKRKVNRNLLVALGGYLIGNALIIIIPTLVESIILRISTNGLGFKLIYGILYLLVTGILIFMIIGINKKTIYKSNKSNKRVKDRSIVMRISLGTIIGFISSGLNLFILPLKYSILGITTINKCMAMENVMQLVVIVIAQLIVSIILIRKIRMYRKVA